MSENAKEPSKYEKQVLAELKAAGYAPKVIYDVGASNGVWSDRIAELLPECEYHLFEPLSDLIDFYKADLQERLHRRRLFHLHPIALGDCDGTATIYVAGDGFGSSLHDRGNIPEVKDRITVPKRRLDGYARERNLPPPDILKIDSQGAEDIILAGAGDLLNHAQILVLECWLKRGYGPQTPLLTEIAELLAAKNFALVEFGERFYDDRHRLYAVDAFFFAEDFLRKFQLTGGITQCARLGGDYKTPE
jgi:FkbM family methyltransferase